MDNNLLSERLSNQKVQVESSGSFQTSTATSPIIRTSDQDEKELNWDPNWSYLLPYVFLINVNGILLGYAMAYSNPLTKTIDVKFEWGDEIEGVKQGLLGGAVTLGMTLGAVAGGMVMRIGRRKAIFYCATIGIIGTGISILPVFYPDNPDGTNDTNFKLNFSLFMIGRFLFGLSVGLFSSICPRYLEETIPRKQYSQLGVLWNLFQGLGTISACYLADVMPSDDDTQALIYTSRWRWSYGYYPLFLYFISLMGLTFVVK